MWTEEEQRFEYTNNKGKEFLQVVLDYASLQS